MSDTVKQALENIASRDRDGSVRSQIREQGESMAELGAPTNNMLLASISASLATLVQRDSSSTRILNSLNDNISMLSQHIIDVKGLLETQNTILASLSIGTPDRSSTSVSKKTGGEWYYQGVPLVSRYKVYACIISHMINMVQLHMDSIGIFYPDSVDCDFQTLSEAVRLSCTNRTSVPNTTYRNIIEIKDTGSQGLDIIYPVIASQDKNTPTTMLESRLTDISNQITRDIMQQVDWIRQRLCYMDCILSVKQIDILKSIQHPFVEDDGLNWNKDSCKPRGSHPLTHEVRSLVQTRKKIYMTERLKNIPVLAALQTAQSNNDKK